MAREIKKRTLRELMDGAGLNNEALAAKFDPPHHPTTISRWNSKERKVSIADATVLAQVFGVAINEMDII